MNVKTLPDIADSRVVEKRNIASGQVIRRRRKLNGSGQMVTTYEIPCEFPVADQLKELLKMLKGRRWTK